MYSFEDSGGHFGLVGLILRKLEYFPYKFHGNNKMNAIAIPNNTKYQLSQVNNDLYVGTDDVPL